MPIKAVPPRLPIPVIGSVTTALGRRLKRGLPGARDTACLASAPVAPPCRPNPQTRPTLDVEMNVEPSTLTLTNLDVVLDKLAADGITHHLDGRQLVCAPVAARQAPLVVAARSVSPKLRDLDRTDHTVDLQQCAHAQVYRLSTSQGAGFPYWPSNGRHHWIFF